MTEVLEIDEATAEEDACHMEHCVSDETMDKLRIFLTEALERSEQKSSQ